MDERRKYAYRFLLYWGIALEVRRNAWFRLPWNPFQWPAAIEQVRRDGSIADWMHNLALFSALEFGNFDEKRFWNWHGLPEEIIAWYRSVFERAMTEFDEFNDTGTETN